MVKASPGFPYFVAFIVIIFLIGAYGPDFSPRDDLPPQRIVYKAPPDGAGWSYNLPLEATCNVPYLQTQDNGLVVEILYECAETE